MQKGLGILLAAAGAALIWLLKKERHTLTRVHVREVKVGNKNGTCGVRMQPANVTMSMNDKLHWIIINEGAPCTPKVEVCMANWTRHGQPINPLEEDDQEACDEPSGNGRLCRTVRPNQRKRLPARVKPGAETGQYQYEVWINGQKAVDPMVEIVP